jgi:adenylate kinase family enzyme
MIDRISILGCSGGGKSTLAGALGEHFGLPVVHLDTLFWSPGWVESLPEPFRERVAEAAAGERWVIDGNFSATFDLRLPISDLIVVIEQSRFTCLRRAFLRTLRWRGRTRPDLAEGCHEKFDLQFYRYIWNYPRDQRLKIRAGVERYGADAKVVFLRSDRDIAAFLRDLPPPTA